jgi:hypothetical protein
MTDRGVQLQIEADHPRHSAVDAPVVRPIGVQHAALFYERGECVGEAACGANRYAGFPVPAD